MSDDPEAPSEEHMNFMKQLQENISAMVQGAPVAVVGDERNGIYGVLLCVTPNMPDSLILVTVVKMLVDQMAKDMGQRFNELQAQRLAGMESPSKQLN